MILFKQPLWAIFILILPLVSYHRNAFPIAGVCPDAGILSSNISENFCFSCLFPIRIAGMSTSLSPLPQGVTTQSFCSCDGFEWGVTVGSWHPTRLIEVVTTPGCSPTTGSHLLTAPTLGSVGHGDHDHGDLAFFHVHDFPFPLAPILDIFGETPCSTGNHATPPYLSELDPSWNHELLAAMMHPEAILFAEPQAIEACSADAVAANLGMPIDSMIWCGGSWGYLYPYTGMVKATSGADPRLTSLMAMRSRALLHRRGLALNTVGDQALCGGVPDPFLKKSHYRMSMLYPVAETNDNHAMGASTSLWGLGHTIPGPGDAPVYLLWQWEDCCLPLY